jgi:hypothetical protein
VIERVDFCEQDFAAEHSISESEKDTFCVLNNQNGGLGANPNCTLVEVCIPTLNAGNGGLGSGHTGGAGLGY